MAEFAQIMKDWRRMCKMFSDEEHECEGCPLEDITEHACGAIFEDEFADVADWAELERRVTKWAKENPEPKYPTWGEYLHTLHNEPSSRELSKLIPADIAEKLGIGPKEDI